MMAIMNVSMRLEPGWFRKMANSGCAALLQQQVLQLLSEHGIATETQELAARLEQLKASLHAASPRVTRSRM